MESRNLIKAVGLSSIFSQFDRTNALSRKYSSFLGDKRSNCCAIWAHWNRTKRAIWSKTKLYDKFEWKIEEQKDLLHGWTIQLRRMLWLFVRRARNPWRIPICRWMVSNDRPIVVLAAQPMSSVAVSFDRLAEVQRILCAMEQTETKLAKLTKQKISKMDWTLGVKWRTWNLLGPADHTN